MAVDTRQAVVGGHPLPPDVLQSIRSASASTGVDFKFLLAQASLESGFQSDARSRRSSAAGLFQFTNQTWLQMMRDHGQKYGQGALASRITTQANGKLGVEDKATEQQILELRQNVELSAHMAAELTKTNAARLEKALGRKPGAYRLVVLENTPRVHNLVVCTLCSCYPRGVLGLPPDWYKSRAYRSRAVREPRTVLREFGTEIPDHVEVRVHDSTADMRYLVLPERPAGSDALSESELAGLVTRDSMIGVAHARAPS